MQGPDFHDTIVLARTDVSALHSLGTVEEKDFPILQLAHSKMYPSEAADRTAVTSYDVMQYLVVLFSVELVH